MDHDMALAYILDRHPELLPSFRMLTPTQQAVVRLTQSEMGFNAGWLVQAEGPKPFSFATPALLGSSWTSFLGCGSHDPQDGFVDPLLLFKLQTSPFAKSTQCRPWTTETRSPEGQS
eukprot:3590632-Amphidinium_carterae.1